MKGHPWTGRARAQAAWAGLPTDRPSIQPICMSFAARFGGVRFRDYAADHRVLAACQLHVAKEFGFDVVALTSDPCREASDLGARVNWFDDTPPALDDQAPLVQDRSDLERLRLPDPLGGGRMHECVKGVAALRVQAGDNHAVLGWVEGPIAEAVDLHGMNNLLLAMVDDPEWVEAFFEFIVDMELRYAQAQVNAGADMIGVGDAAASLVSAGLYEELVLPAERRLIEGIVAMGVPVRLHICGRIDQLLPGIATLPVAMVDVDAKTDLAAARVILPPSVAILGNSDPVSVFRAGPRSRIQEELMRCAHTVGQRAILGAGCELPPDTDPDHVRAFRDASEALACGETERERW